MFDNEAAPEATTTAEDGKFPAGIPVYDFYRFKAAPAVTVTVEVLPDQPLTPAEVKDLAIKELEKAKLQLSLLEDLPDDLPMTE